jgi:hypothetical protein
MGLARKGFDASSNAPPLATAGAAPFKDKPASPLRPAAASICGAADAVGGATAEPETPTHLET